MARRPRPARELRPSELRWRCDPAIFRRPVPPSKIPLLGIIGQDRAIRAMKLGIELDSPGYNVFVCGITGTGRTTTVKRILESIRSTCPLAPDRCYVHNFRQPDRPRLLTLPRGRGREFRRDMERFAREVQRMVPRLLESEDFIRKRQRLARTLERKGDRLIERFEKKARREGFELKRVHGGGLVRPELFPLIEGKPVPLGEVEERVAQGRLPAATGRSLAGRYARLREEFEGVARRGRTILREIESETAALEREQVRKALEEPARLVLEKHRHEAIESHLHEAVAHIGDRVDVFRPGEGGEPADHAAIEDLLALLAVNVVLDNTAREECPVVVETLPTYRRLFGSYEKEMDRSGNWTTDFRRIRAGAILQADGGYLVLNAEDLFTQPGVWPRLKRALVTRQVEISEEGTPVQVPVITLTPEPIPVNVKVILIGDAATYRVLYERDTDFRKIFKVLADFDDEMERSARNLTAYAAFVARMGQEEGLARFEPGAIAAVAEYGARRAGQRRRLTARFGDISDLLREADYFRGRDGAARVGARHVAQARREAERRNGMWEVKLRDLIAEDLVHIETRGRRVGQVNGLAVHTTGPHVFGLPGRITAAAAPGEAGIINIEREARLSGKTYDKGVLIIGGWFRETYGRERPVTFAASIAFEQSYGEIEGDSASLAEVCALLSALSGAGIDQGVSVTGSIDQKGFVQAVGGINEKVEGWFEACRRKGPSARQGVIIPEANAGDLMLREEVVAAVRRSRFHVYPVRTVDEGIAILTGRPAGTRRPDGTFTPGSLHDLVARRLARIYDLVRAASARVLRG